MIKKGVADEFWTLQSSLMNCNFQRKPEALEGFCSKTTSYSVITDPQQEVMFLIFMATLAQ